MLELDAYIADGKIQEPYKLKLIQDYLHQQDGRKVWIRLAKPKRTTLANRYYWAIVKRWCDFLRCAGHSGDVRVYDAKTGEQIGGVSLEQYYHETWKSRYLGAMIYDDDSGDVVRVRSTTDLNRQEFFDYCEQVKNDPEVLASGCEFKTLDQYRYERGESHAEW